MLRATADAGDVSAHAGAPPPVGEGANLRGRAFIYAGIGMAALIAAVTAFALHVYRDAALNIGRWHLDNLANVLVAQTSHAVKSIDVVLLETAKDYAELPSGGRDMLSALQRRLADRVARLPQLNGVIVMDGGGQAVAYSGDGRPPRANYADREYFKTHRDSASGGLHVGEPVMGRLTGELAYTLSHRIEGSRGEFLGVVAGSVNIAHFHDLYASLGMGDAGRVLLFRRDGLLLTTFPPDAPGSGVRSFPQHPLFARHVEHAPSGVIEERGFLDDRRRVIAYRGMADYPLVIAVSSERSHLLAEWRRQAWQIGAGAALAAAFFVALGFWLARQAHARQALADEVVSSERQLRENEARLNGIIESAMDAVITTDERQRIVLYNAAAEKIFGVPRAQAMGSMLERLIPERFRAAHRVHVERFGATGVTMRHMGVRSVLYGLRANGEEFPIDASISQVAVGARRFYTVILRDISESHRAAQALERSHRELRELYGRMNEVREAERMRIARELHDELAQWLTALKMDASWLAGRLPPDAAALLDRVRRMKDVIDTTVGAVRRIAADLRPVMLDDLGLVPAIEHLLHEFSQRSGIVIGLDVADAVQELRDPVATAVYRMVQETLTNVARHAQATEVQVTIRVDGDMLEISVRDNGVGFDPARQGGHRSYGLLGIRERAQTLGGSAVIASAPGAGTEITIRIPLGLYAAAKETA
jgi:PAS domain S-box-containing protein